ncbi:MAG: sterol desaturase family protein [Acidimicrobiales bacterium]
MDVIVAVVAFSAMEPVTYAAHRWVMHGVGWALHRSHHRRRAARFEANDAFPVMFAAVTVAVMAAGALSPSLHLLVSVAVGVTAYGAAYAFVHDVYIHARLGRLPALGPLERLRDAHAIHHLYGGEPYGMLCPVVPRRLRQRAAARAGLAEIASTV